MLDSQARRLVAAELREKRHQQSTVTERWIVCPASLAPGVEPHAVRVLVRKRHYAYCAACELQFGLHGPLWEGRGPLTLSGEEAASWLTTLKQIKSPQEVQHECAYPVVGLPNGSSEPSGNA